MAQGNDSAIQRLPGDPPSPWEVEYSFSRVVRAGPFVIVGGTTSVGPDGSIIGATPYEQAKEIYRKLENELARAGATLADVISSHTYVTDASRAAEVGRAHGETFGEHRPLMTLVEVSGLIDPLMLVEIEATAYLG